MDCRTSGEGVSGESVRGEGEGGNQQLSCKHPL